MPIHTSWWDDQASILIEKFKDEWSWNDVTQESLQVVYPLLASVDHPIALIQDMLGSHWIPSMTLLQQVKAMFDTAPLHDAITVLVIVSGEPSVDALLLSAFQLYGKKSCTYKTAPSIPKAIELIEQFQH